MRVCKKMNSRGFTLLEMLVVLAVVLLVVSFFPLLLDVRWLHEKQNEFQPLEWQVFLQQIKSEIREAKELENVSTTLYAYKPTGQGNEIVLQNVSYVQYQLATTGVQITVTATNGKRYEAFVSTFFPVQVRR
mgnify:CR=1 FL=1